MKLKSLAAIVAATALTVVGIATAANATEPSNATVAVSHVCVEGSAVPNVSVTVTGETHYVLLQVNDAFASEGRLIDVNDYLAANPVAIGDAVAVGIQVTDGLNPDQLRWSATYVVLTCDDGPTPPTHGTVTSVTETKCDLVSSEVPEGEAKVVYTDIDGADFTIVVGGLTAGTNAGVLDDGTYEGLALDITISACDEPTSPPTTPPTTPPVVTPPVVTPPVVTPPAVTPVVTPPATTTKKAATPAVKKTVTEAVPTAVDTD